jgi:primosomal protein N'
VIAALKSHNTKGFYDEELRMRKELGFCPFGHWVKITLRAKSEKSAQEAASGVYNQLSRSTPEHCSIMPPVADVITRRRDQFIFHVMVHAPQVVGNVAFIRSALGQIKRRSQVRVTLNVDP